MLPGVAVNPLIHTGTYVYEHVLLYCTTDSLRLEVVEGGGKGTSLMFRTRRAGWGDVPPTIIGGRWVGDVDKIYVRVVIGWRPSCFFLYVVRVPDQGTVCDY